MDKMLGTGRIDGSVVLSGLISNVGISGLSVGHPPVSYSNFGHIVFPRRVVENILWFACWCRNI